MTRDGQESAWERLNTDSFKIYRRRGDFLFRYTVTGPGPISVGVAITLWGAKRLLRKARRGERGGAFWENEIVIEVK